MRVLLVGLPRSGTTWICNALSEAPGVHYVHEPDNPGHFPFAHVGTRHLGPLPEPAPDQRLRSFELLWELAYGAGWPTGRTARAAERVSFSPTVPRPLRIAVQEVLARAAVRRPAVGQHQFVKTVRSYLAAEWIASRCDAHVVVVWRNPLNTISSWRRLGWGACTLQRTDAVKRFTATEVWPPPPEEDRIATAAWGVCAGLTLLLEAAVRNPAWTVVKHEDICADAQVGLRRLFDSLGLEWSESVEANLAAADAPGSSWEVTRIRADEPRIWAERLSAGEQRTALRTVARFRAVSDPYGAFSDALSDARLSPEPSSAR